MITLVFIPGVLNTDEVFLNIKKSIQGKINFTTADTFNFDNFTDMSNNILSEVKGDIIPVGLSMGGYCALELLRLSPDRIKGIVLFNTGAKPPTKEQKIQRQKTIRSSKVGRFIGVSNLVINRILGKQALKNKNIHKLLKKMANNCGRDVFIRQQQCIIDRLDPRQTIKESNIPILCIAGQYDQITPSKLLQEINKIGNNTTYFEIANCGHMSILEYPQETLKIFKDWIKINFYIDL